MAAPLLFWSKSGSGATFQVAVAQLWWINYLLSFYEERAKETGIAYFSGKGLPYDIG